MSREVYKGILIEAEMLTHDLTLRYGVLSSECKNEEEYLLKAEKLTMQIMEIIETEDYRLEELFWGNPPDKDELRSTLREILNNIEKVKSIPVEKRNMILIYKPDHLYPPPLPHSLTHIKQKSHNSGDIQMLNWYI